MDKIFKSKGYWVEGIRFKKNDIHLKILGPKVNNFNLNNIGLLVVARDGVAKEIFRFEVVSVVNRGKVEYSKFSINIPVEYLEVSFDKNFEVVKVLDFYLVSNKLKKRIACPYSLIDSIKSYNDLVCIPYSTSKNNFSISLVKKRSKKKQVLTNDSLSVNFILYNISYKSGQAKAILDLASSLAKKNHDVNITSLLIREGDSPFKFPENVSFNYVIDTFGVASQELYRINYALDSDIRFTEYEINSLSDFLGGIRCDLVYFSGFSNELVTCLNSLPSSVALVSGDHDGWRYHDYEKYTAELSYASFNKEYSYFTYMAYLSDGFHIVNPLMEEFLSNKPVGDILNIPNIYDSFGDNISDAYSLENKTLVAVGRLSKEKNFDLLILAFKSISKNFPDWRLVIYGEGDERENLELIVKECGVEAKVELPGFNRNIDEVYDNSSIHVVSSFIESFGLTIVEAMGKGVPVVSFGVSIGSRYLVEDGVTGFVAKTASIEGLVDKVEEVIVMFEAKSEKIISVRRNAFEHVKTFNASAISDQWEMGMRALIDKKRNSLTESKLPYKKFYQKYWVKK